jgi:hypothetical protein
MNTKQCCRCNQEKQLEEFYYEKRRSCHYAHCKLCHAQSTKSIYEKKIAAGEISVKWKQKPIQDDNKYEIIDLYNQGIGAYRIAKQTGFNKTTILRLLQKEGLLDKDRSYRKYHFKNENYFDVLRSDDQFYFLGLLWADGCNYRKQDKRKNAFQIHLTLAEEDGYLVRELANRIFQSDDIVTMRDRSQDTDFFNKNMRRKNQISLRIPSKHISDKLLYYGMEPRKSLVAKMPVNIEWTENNFRSFLRGMMDGDGSIFFNSHSKNYGCSLIGSVEQMKEISFLVEKFLNIKLCFCLLTRYSEPMANLKVHGDNKTKIFLDWLYKNSTICMVRKYQKYLNLKTKKGEE